LPPPFPLRDCLSVFPMKAASSAAEERRLKKNGRPLGANPLRERNKRGGVRLRRPSRR